MPPVVVLCVVGCPNVSTVLERLRVAGALDEEVRVVEIGDGDPIPPRFAGSPTVLIAGENPLGDVEVCTELSCTLRMPSLEQLRQALDRR